MNRDTRPYLFWGHLLYSTSRLSTAPAVSWEPLWDVDLLTYQTTRDPVWNEAQWHLTELLQYRCQATRESKSPIIISIVISSETNNKNVHERETSTLWLQQVRQQELRGNFSFDIKSATNVFCTAEKERDRKRATESERDREPVVVFRWIFTYRERFKRKHLIKVN